MILGFAVIVLSIFLIHRTLDGFSMFLKTTKETRKGVVSTVFSVCLMFCTGFLLRLSTDSALIDIGYFLTDFSFLLSYLLIAFAALFGQAKYYGN